MQLWELHNATPFAAAAQFERDEKAAAYWCVWIKATFDVAADGRVTLSDAQEPLLTAPETDDAGLLLADVDQFLPKAATDILMDAMSRPPEDWKRASAYPVAASVGDWHKALTVRPAADWRWMKGAQVREDSAPAIPLSYAYGFGGTITDADGNEERFEANPAGAGFAPRAGRKDVVPAPRLFHKGERWKGPKDRPRPAGFGPIARHWLDRAKLAGTFDTDWMQTRAPLLPKDHDPAFRHAAPVDQRYPGHLQGGEEVRLVGVDWSGAAAPAFALPRLDFTVDSHFRGRWVAHRMQIDTLHLRPTTGQFTLCWCGTLPIGAARHDVALRETQISLRKGTGFAVAPEVLDQFYMQSEAL